VSAQADAAGGIFPASNNHRAPFEGAHDHARSTRSSRAVETVAREGQQAMTMTDPIADMLTRLRNANSAYHDSVAMPYSKIKAHIAEILQQEGYISGWAVEDAEVGKKLTIELKFGPTRERSIAGIKRVSKASW